jgi:predicted restriction endonuclease
MKKIVLGILTFIILAIGSYTLRWNLPLTINRSGDIKLGEKIISNIGIYQKENGLPDNNDWETLRKFGFRDKIDFLQPEYRKLDNNNFELVFIEGFDGPYLMWTSIDRQWKKGYPTVKQTPDNAKKSGI